MRRHRAAQPDGRLVRKCEVNLGRGHLGFGMRVCEKIPKAFVDLLPFARGKKGPAAGAGLRDRQSSASGQGAFEAEEQQKGELGL